MSLEGSPPSSPPELSVRALCHVTSRRELRALVTHAGDPWVAAWAIFAACAAFIAVSECLIFTFSRRCPRRGRGRSTSETSCPMNRASPPAGADGQPREYAIELVEET